MTVYFPRVNCSQHASQLDIFSIFFSSYLHKNKVTSNSQVDCWHLTLLGAKSCVTHLSDKNLSLVIIFTLDVCSLNL